MTDDSLALKNLNSLQLSDKEAFLKKTVAFFKYHKQE